MKKPLNLRFLVLFSVITLLAAWRVLSATDEISSWATFSPVGAMALFGGAYFSNKLKAYSLPLLFMFLSDFALMQTIYAPYRSGLLYDNWHWTYIGFAIMVLIGDQFMRRVSVKRVLLGGFGAAMVHFLLSNLGVWLAGGFDHATGMPYTKDWSGLLSCYAAAIPYFKNFLSGTIVFSTILFGGFEFAQSRIPRLKLEVSHQ